MAHAPTLLGNLTPPFDLPCTRVPDPSRQRAALADYRGRWVILIFYPRDFSLVCPTELTGLSAKAEEFRRHGCDLLGISCDTLESHEQWITTPRSQGGLGGLNYPLASDEDGSVSRAYGVYLEYQHAALRGLFIIDPNGVLQYQAVHNLSVGRRSDEILRVLNALQTGGLCGENWSSPGDTIDPTMVLVPNSVVSHYRIEAEVGSGTFAKVYRARDLLLDRSVALKVLKRDSPMAPGTVLAEAPAAAALSHPNVCTIFAVDDSLGVPVIAMEYLRGRTLCQILAETSGPLDLERVASLGRQIALGMATAHDLRIVHGDLKPENVIVSAEGVAKILDFGLSRRQSRTGSLDETLELGSGETGSALVGTPSYMAPEQTAGQPASQASDVFALGVILFEMLAGRRAFPSKSLLQVLDQIRRVDAEALASEVPEPFAPIVRLALVRNPDDRVITMRQIAERLGNALQPADAR